MSSRTTGCVAVVLLHAPARAGPVYSSPRPRCRGRPAGLFTAPAVVDINGLKA
jgi:hypothetical protein